MYMYRNLSIEFFVPILTTIKTLSEAQMAHTGSSVPYKKIIMNMKIGDDVLNW